VTERLARVIGAPGAVLLGLGSMLGTGIFVSVGTAAGVAGPAVLLAVVLAALVAALNGLSSAELAASHPVSGGTYEYGYRYLGPALGFTAGWMFLWAKSASAATAALGFAGYALAACGLESAPLRSALAVLGIGALGLLGAHGMQRTSRVNALVVGFTLVVLLVFVVSGLSRAAIPGPADLGEPRALFEATALMFVAYTGYGRIATLGEEVREPERNIPRAIVLCLVASAVLYALVTAVALGVLGADGLARATRATGAPLELAARELGSPLVVWLLRVGAVTAMLGIALNLLLGLSRVLLAMARRGDAPRALARLTGEPAAPQRAVAATTALVAALALCGDVKLTWSLSAFSVLVYYAITNLAALQLPAGAQRHPRWIPVAGLVACLGLAFWVEPRAWAAGLALIAVGLVWHTFARRVRAV